MAQTIDMLDTYFRKAQLPKGLRKPPSQPIPEVAEAICKGMVEKTYAHSLILLNGLQPGKTVTAGTLLRTWLETKRETIDSGLPGYFVPVHQLCYQNRSVDRYHRDEGLQEIIRNACRTDFLVLDGIFSYLTQNDDLLLQSIYDARQHSCKTTVVTTSIIDPLACAGSVLFRVFRDADIKITF